MRKLFFIIGAAAIVVVAAIFMWKITNRQADTQVKAVPEQNYPIADVTFPGHLNKLFTENNVYNSEGEILWNNISKAYPDIRVTAPAYLWLS